MADSQRSKARALVDPDVLTLGRETQRTRKTTNPVAQANMSRFGPASPQPRLTPTSIPFKKGGSTAGKAKKVAAVAGMLSALAQGAQQAPSAPPPAAAPDMSAMGAPPGPGMRRGGRYAKGGHADEAEDKVLFKRMFKQEESKEAKKMARGGRARCAEGGSSSSGIVGPQDIDYALKPRATYTDQGAMGKRGAKQYTDDEGNSMNGMKRGGRSAYAKGGHAHKKHHMEGSDAEEAGESPAEEAAEGEEGMRRGGRLHKARGGGVSHVPERGEGNRKPDSGTGGNLVPRNKMARGGHAGRQAYAAGGVAKMRRGVADKSGMPTKPKRGSYDNLI